MSESKKKQGRPKKDKVNVTLESMGEIHVSEGATVYDALSNMKLEWQQIVGKGIMVVKKGTKRHEHLFNLKQLRRIFANKIIRMKWAHNLEFLMKEGPDSNIPKKLEV